MKIGLGLSLTMKGFGSGVADTSPLKVIVTGQSNAEFMFSTTASPPAASAGTFFWDGASLTTVPLANGARELANALKAAFPLRDIHLAEAATAGQASGYFISGQAGWTDFVSRHTGLGGVDLVIVQQGEGDGANGTVGVTPIGATKGLWKSNWTTISNQISALAGRTIPVLFIGLSTFGGTQAANSDAQWSAVQAGIKELSDEYAHMYYSHSMYDATLIDTYHYDGASYGRSGKRAASLGATVLGGSGGLAAWFITNMSVVSATQTDVTVAHALGTDFTPTTGITGFSISNNNGATWESPSAAVRQSSTVVRLTHSDLGLVVDRQLRYLYGTAPVITGLVIDNSTAATPLTMSAGSDVSVAGSGGYPVPTWRGAYSFTTTGVATVTAANVSLGPNTAAADTVVFVSLTNATPASITSATLTPRGGSAITGTVMVQRTTDDLAGIIRFIVPASTTGLGMCALSIVLSGSVFNATAFNVWTVPQARMSSTTPVDTDAVSTAAVTSQTLQMSSTVNGFTIAVAVSDVSGTFTWTGDDTMVERFDQAVGAQFHTVADSSNTIAGTDDNAVTVTSTASGRITLVAATFR